MGKVVLATNDLSIHEAMGEDRQVGRVLGAGETFPYDQLSSDLKKRLDDGENIPGLEVLNEDEVNNRKNELFARAAGVVAAPTTSLPVTDDGSFSDHLVPDEVRTENLDAQQKEEGGEPVDPAAPREANVGRKTRSAVRGDNSKDNENPE